MAKQKEKIEETEQVVTDQEPLISLSQIIAIKKISGNTLVRLNHWAATNKTTESEMTVAEWQKVLEVI